MDYIGMVLTLIVVELFRRQKLLHAFSLGVVNECVWVYIGWTTQLGGLQILSTVLLMQYVWGVKTWWRGK